MEGLTSSPHHLRNEHSLLTPVNKTVFSIENGCCQLYLGQMSAPPHFGFGFGPPDPGAFEPREAAQYYTRNISSAITQPTSHIGR